MTALIRRTALLFAALGLLGIASTRTFAASPAVLPDDSAASVVESGRRGTLLLNNGNLLEGVVCRVGDGYQVTVTGGQVDVRGSDVRFVAASRDEVYQRLCGTIANDNAVDHLRLAHWCIRWQLLGCAAREIIIALEIDPKCPGIDALKRQVHAAAEAGKVRPANHATHALAHTVPARRRQRTLHRKRAGRSSGRRAAVANREIPPQVPARPATVNGPTATARVPGSVGTTPRGLAPPKATPLVPRRRPAERPGDASKPQPSTHRPAVERAEISRPRDAFDPEVFNSRQAASQ
jgi:hypothetical protein